MDRDTIASSSSRNDDNSIRVVGDASKSRKRASAAERRSLSEGQLSAFSRLGG